MRGMQVRMGVTLAAIGLAVAGVATPVFAAAGTTGAVPADVVVSASGKSVAELPLRSRTADRGTTTESAGWLGPCYATAHPTNARSGGGWCDGNGPDARYQGFVECSNSTFYYGPERWAGDRTRSYATCPSGTSRIDYGVIGYYV